MAAPPRPNQSTPSLAPAATTAFSWAAPAPPTTLPSPCPHTALLLPPRPIFSLRSSRLAAPARQAGRPRPPPCAPSSVRLKARIAPCHSSPPHFMRPATEFCIGRIAAPLNDLARGLAAPARLALPSPPSPCPPPPPPPFRARSLLALPLIFPFCCSRGRPYPLSNPQSNPTPLGCTRSTVVH